MLVNIIDQSGELYHINPSNVIYIKERPTYGWFKIAIVNGETIMTKDSDQARALIDFLSNRVKWK